MQKLFLYFIIYSFLGWAIESAYVSVLQRRLINRGFLNGPLCPIYGTGAMLITIILGRFTDVPTVFVFGIAITTVLEYIVGFLLEKLFSARWWDYSSHRFNINGRVSLLSSFYWGLLCIALVFFIHPLMERLVSHIPARVGLVVSWIMFALIAVDLVITVPSVITLNIRLKKLHNLYEDLQEKLKMLPAINEKINDLKEKYNEIISKRNLFHIRIITAFPSLRSIKFDNALTQLKNKIIRKNNNKSKKIRE